MRNAARFQWDSGRLSCSLLAGLGSRQDDKPQDPIELPGVDRLHWQVATDPDVACLACGESQKRKPSVPPEERALCDLPGSAYRGLDPEEPIAQGEPEVQGPARRLDRQSPFGLGEAPVVSR